MEPIFLGILQIIKEEVGPGPHSKISRLFKKISCPCRWIQCTRRVGIRTTIQ
jgi:hypothetical protein